MHTSSVGVVSYIGCTHVSLEFYGLDGLHQGESLAFGQEGMRLDRFPSYLTLQKIGGSCCAIKPSWAYCIAHHIIWALSTLCRKGYWASPQLDEPLGSYEEARRLILEI